MKSEEWISYNLDELYEISSGLSKSRSEFGFGNSFLTFKEVFNNTFIPEELNELVNSSETEQLKCSIQRGDVFLTRTSEKLEELGLSAVSLKNYPKATFNGFTKRLRPRVNFILPEYAGFYFRSPKFRRQVTSMASMTTRASLNNSMLSKLFMDVPPINIQEKIVKILYSINSKIMLNNQINSNLEELAKTLFNHWFIDFEFPSEDGKPYRSNGGKMVESEIGLVPEGWKLGGLSDLGNIVGGGTPSKKIKEYYTDQGVGWITPRDLSRDKSIFIGKGATDITEEALKKSSAKLLPGNSVLFSSRAPIGYVAIAARPVSTNQGFKSIVPNPHIPREFVYFLLKHLTPTIEANAGGSTFKEISGKGMKSINIVIPDENILNLYQEKVHASFSYIKELEKENRKLTSLRNILLPKLLSGEIKLNEKSEVMENAFV